MEDDMPKLATDDKQLTLIYSAQTRVGKHALAYLQGSRKKIDARNIDEAPLTGSQWAAIADTLGKNLGELVDTESIEKGKDANDFSTDDWVKVLEHQPQVLTHPIVINGEEMKQVANPTEVLSFFGVDSAGIEKTPYTEEPSTPDDVSS